MTQTINIGKVYYEFKTYGVAFETFSGFPTANPGDLVVFELTSAGFAEGDRSYLLYNNYAQQFRLVYDEAQLKDIDYTMWVAGTYVGRVLDANTMLILSF